MTQVIASDLLAALDILALERVDRDCFRILTTKPNWFISLQQEAATSNQIDIVLTFPFLETFLSDAEYFWQENSKDKLKSGAWSETDLQGEEFNLEATAFSLQEKKILLLQRLGYDYEEKQQLLQRLREDNLNKTKMAKEIRAEIITNIKSPDWSGQTLNERYKLEHILGKGGLGVVYQTTDLLSGQVVALKMLLENADEDVAYAHQLFEREIKVLRRIHHPNVVSILDSGITSTGRPYLVMEYIEGEPLSKLLQEERVWSVARTLNLLQSICPALQAIHDHKIIHRDLKPANIMVRRQDGKEEAILLDLGIAKMVRGETDSSLIKTLTKTGLVLGTVQYLSPEQCLGRPLDEGTDIYSLGMIIYELLAGMLPFQPDSVQAWMMAHVQVEPQPLRKVNPSIPPAVDKVVCWAIAKYREHRPKDVMQFLARFESASQRSMDETLVPD